MAISERLKYSRERSGLTLQQVSDRAGIGLSSLSDFENGRREPRTSQLAALAQLYRRSVDFFLDDRPVPQETVLWRMRPEAPEETERTFLRLCEQYHNLEVWCQEKHVCSLPQARHTVPRFGYADAERLAYQVRADLKLGDRPGETLLTVLQEACGVKIFHLPLRPTGTAACTYDEGLGAAILLNSNHVRWRRNFDLAHELFHLLTWNLFRRPSADAPVSPSEDEEKLATCFARHLLMPVEPLRVAIGQATRDNKLSVAKMLDVAREFDVSVEALLWHLSFLYRRSKEETQSDIERVKRISELFDERVRDTPPSRPLRFVRLAVTALHRGEMSAGKFAEYMGITRKEAERFANEPPVEDEEVALTAA